MNQRICRTAYTFFAPVQYVRVDHGRSDVSVPQELLNRLDVVDVFKEMCGDSRMGSFYFLVAGLVHSTRMRLDRIDGAAVVQAGWVKVFWITYGIAQRLPSRSVPLLTAISTGLYNHRSAQCITS